MRNIGGRIRSLRTERQITLPTLAERSGLSKGLISKLENEEASNPSLETLHKIAKALDVTLGDILETEQVQITRLVPEKGPEWQKGLIKYLASHGKKPDPDILNALYLLRNRKAAKDSNLEQWIFLYQSIEKSFAK